MPPSEFQFMQPAWSQDEIIERLRKSREVRFNTMQYDMWIRHPLTVSLGYDFDPKIPKITDFAELTLNFDHLQDLCNKPITLYWADINTTQSTAVYRHVMQHWAEKGNLHKTDIEFGRFFAKLIRIEREPHQIKPSILAELICQTHDSVCREYYHSQANLHKHLLEEEQQISRRGIYGVNKLQAHNYHLKPIFQALVMVLTEQVNDMNDQMVVIVRTGVTEGLSKRIVFPCSKGASAKIVTMKLTDAVSFILELDRREEKACPTRKNLTKLDKTLGLPYLSAERWGWRGGVITGPSTTWIKQRSTDVTECVFIPDSPDELSLRNKQEKVKEKVKVNETHNKRRLDKEKQLEDEKEMETETETEKKNETKEKESSVTLDQSISIHVGIGLTAEPVVEPKAHIKVVPTNHCYPTRHDVDK